MSSSTSILPADYEIVHCNQSSQCPICKKRLGAQAALAGKKLFHPDCLTCLGCRTILVDGFAGSIEQPQCAECYIRLYPPTCDGCAQPFEGNVCLKFLGKYYHRLECAKCFDCREPFKKDQYYPFANGAYCSDCYWRRRLNA